MSHDKTGNQYTHNHYVPEWYQKRFMFSGQSKYWYLDMNPDVVTNRGVKYTRRNLLNWGPASCFAQDDLYTTRWGTIKNTDIERFFFGKLDNDGNAAVEYFANFKHPSVDEEAYRILMRYMSVQRFRTPKGLGHLSAYTQSRHQNLSLLLLQNLEGLYAAIWTECVWQIADASRSATKLIISDHPVTVYNRSCYPGSKWCQGFDDPDIRLVGTHTYFPLSIDKVLILTNLSWVRDPYQREFNLRPNPEFFRHAIFNFTKIQTDRFLTENEVIEINYITKRRAHRYIAAAEKEWLYPEDALKDHHWRRLGDGYLMMPEPREIYMGGEVIIGYGDGKSDVFGEYGHRPWQAGYKDAERDRREWDSLERFKAEWAAMYGPTYRGVSFEFGSVNRPPPKADSPEMHDHYLKMDAHYRANAEERKRRKRLLRKR